MENVGIEETIVEDGMRGIENSREKSMGELGIT